MQDRRLLDRRKGASGRTAVDLVGRSEAFIELMKQIERVAMTSLTVLLTGESGTGKAVVASAVHRRSLRAAQPFVTVNCGAIPAELIESELFGQVKGSLTGADRDSRGLWEEANGGMIFLDEITETSTAFQVKLLRALQEGEIRPVGCDEAMSVDVRVIAASNREVEQEVEGGRFRKDLFYGLNAVAILLPPLRDRREDILPLATCFAERVNSRNPRIRFSPGVLELLESYPWPGNVRELENAIVCAATLCDGTIRAQDLPERVRSYQRSMVHQAGSDKDETPVNEDAWLSLAHAEGLYVRRVLAHTGGNKAAAARLLEVDRKTLDRMISRHRISLESESGPPPRAV